MGLRRMWRVLGHTATATVCCERTKSPPFGLFEGHAGSPTSVHLVDPSGRKKPLNSKGPAFPVPADHSILYEVAGSGGYGNPAQRDAGELRDDVINGYVSEAQAAQEYGVEETSQLRCPPLR